MSEIRFACPHCAARIGADESLRGAAVVCPVCRADAVVPPAEAAAAPPAPNVGRFVAAPLSETADEEHEVFELAPTPRAYPLRLLLGVLLAPLGLGLLLLLNVWWRTHALRYRLTNQRLFVRVGLLAKRCDELELFRVKDVRVSQTLLQRLLDVGDVLILSSDETTPRILLAGLAQPTAVKEVIRTHYRAARRREGVRAAELIPS